MGFVTDALGITSRDPKQNAFKAIQAPLQQIELGKATNDARAAMQYASNAQDSGMNDLIQALSNRAYGRGGPSVAQMQLRQGMNRNVANAASSAASARGINPAMAARMALQAQQQAGQEMAGQSAILRANEQLAAESSLGQAIGQRADMAANNFSLSANQMNAQNQQQLQNYAMEQGLNQATTAQNTQLAADNDARRGGVIGGLVGGIASAGMNALGGAISPKKIGSSGTTSSGIASSGPQMYAHGGMIAGDHPQNDVVPAMLSPGEIVLPRSVTQSDNPEERAKEFVAAIKKGKK